MSGGQYTNPVRGIFSDQKTSSPPPLSSPLGSFDMNLFPSFCAFFSISFYIPIHPVLVEKEIQLPLSFIQSHLLPSLNILNPNLSLQVWANSTRPVDRTHDTVYFSPVVPLSF